MAAIVNDKSMPNAGKTTRKQELYAKVPFSDLYEYNDPIANLIGLSEKIFSNYISEALQIIKRDLPNADPGNYTALNITRYRADILEDCDEDSLPKKLLFSVLQIIDPFCVDVDKTYEMLKNYIEIGCYPVVTQPMPLSEAIPTYEKYCDLCEGRRMMGTIVDVTMVDGKLDAVIMWDPYFTTFSDEMSAGYRADEMLGFESAYITFIDMLETPDVWKDESTSFMNFAVPMFEHRAFRHGLSIINGVNGFADYLNEAVVTGNLKLDFVDSTLQMATATAQAVNNMMANQQDDPEDELDNAPKDVIVENAEETDEFGHRMRLYREDEIYDDDDDDSVEIFDDDFEII